MTDIVIKSKFNSVGGNTAAAYVDRYTARSGAVEPIGNHSFSDDAKEALLLDASAARGAIRRLKDEKTKAVTAPVIGNNDRQLRSFLEGSFNNDGILFGNHGLSYDQAQYQRALKKVGQAEKQGHTPIMTVVSFDNDYLKKQNVIDKKAEVLDKGDLRDKVDQLKLRQAVSAGMDRMLMTAGYSQPEWTGTLQMDTKHVHAHLVLLETVENPELQRSIPVMTESDKPLLLSTEDQSKISSRDFDARFTNYNAKRGSLPTDLVLLASNIRYDSDQDQLYFNHADKRIDLKPYVDAQLQNEKDPLTSKSLGRVDFVSSKSDYDQVLAVQALTVNQDEQGDLFCGLHYKEQNAEQYIDYGERGKLWTRYRNQMADGINGSLDLQKDLGRVDYTVMVDRAEKLAGLNSDVFLKNKVVNEIQDSYRVLPEVKDQWKIDSRSAMMIPAQLKIGQLSSDLLAISDKDNHLSDNIDRFIKLRYDDSDHENVKARIYTNAALAASQSVYRRLNDVDGDDLEPVDPNRVLNKEDHHELSDQAQLMDYLDDPDEKQIRLRNELYQRMQTQMARQRIIEAKEKKARYEEKLRRLQAKNNSNKEDKDHLLYEDHRWDNIQRNYQQYLDDAGQKDLQKIDYQQMLAVDAPFAIQMSSKRNEEMSSTYAVDSYQQNVKLRKKELSDYQSYLKTQNRVNDLKDVDREMASVDKEDQLGNQMTYKSLGSLKQEFVSMNAKQRFARLGVEGIIPAWQIKRPVADRLFSDMVHDTDKIVKAYSDEFDGVLPLEKKTRSEKVNDHLQLKNKMIELQTVTRPLQINDILKVERSLKDRSFVDLDSYRVDQLKPVVGRKNAVEKPEEAAVVQADSNSHKLFEIPEDLLNEDTGFNAKAFDMQFKPVVLDKKDYVLEASNNREMDDVKRINRLRTDSDIDDDILDL